MRKITFFLVLALIGTIETTKADNRLNNLAINVDITKDSTRLIALNSYWKELSRTVREGDFEGYGMTYHEDAVVIFATGKNKISNSLSVALAGWKQGFDNTKSGKVKSDVTFRFSQRIGDNTTAHETGIFHYMSIDSDGKELANQLIHFEMLLVKKNGKWLGVMEYQKSIATQEEWNVISKLY